MRKLFTLSFAAMVATVAMADPIDAARALRIAKDYAADNVSPDLVMTARRTPSKAKRLSAKVAALPPYYVYRRGAGQGYVVVAGDDCLPEVLGYTDAGDFDETDLPPALQDMLAEYAQYVEDAQANGTNQTRAPQQRAASKRKNIAPFTTSQWHQGSPYNDLAPLRWDNKEKSTAGCVATAASQILYYWRRDLSTTLGATTPINYESGNAQPTVVIKKGTPIKWELMRDSYNNEPSEYKQAVAELCYSVGTINKLKYSDGDGTATSGYIENIPNTFSTAFGMNGGWVAYRSNYDQEAWIQLLYNELDKGRPVMYCGYSETNGGHAVYVHGYQVSGDRFRYNFGWGGGGDGWWTTTPQDGMNGFPDGHSALIGACPKKRNIKTTIKQPEHVYSNVDNNFLIDVENNSTLPLSGVYVFASNTQSKPSSLTKAKASDTKTVIPSGEKGVISLPVRPTSARTWYITVTDETLTVLAQKTVTAELAETQLTLTALNLQGSSETKEVGGQKYAQIYNNQATVKASVMNEAQLPFGGTARLDLYKSTDNGATFEFEKTVVKANATVLPSGEAHSISPVEFSVTGLTADALYCVELNPEWGGTGETTMVDVAMHGKRLYFQSAGAADLNATLGEDGTLVFTGHWDAAQYATIVGRSANKTAKAYDLTQVEAMGSEIPADITYPNPNALVYVSDEVNVEGVNVIYDGLVLNSVLTAGYDFLPKSNLSAWEGSIRLNQEPNRWYLLTVPFEVTVPDGVIARQINSHSVTGVDATNVKVLKAGNTYLVMAASSYNQTLCYDGELETMDILGAPAANADPNIIGTYAATELPEGAKIVKDKEVGKQYFMHTAEGQSEGLRGYFYDEAMASNANNFRAYANATLDPTYITLGEAIQQLYEAQNIYAERVTDEANAAMRDSIAHANATYSDQSITSTTSVKKYAQALLNWAEKYKQALVGDQNLDIDATQYIANPSFEKSTVSAKEWDAETAADVKIRKNSDLTYMTVYGDGSNFLSNSKGSMVSQTVEGIPEGYYRLSAKVGAPNDNAAITLSAGEQTATVASHAFGKHYLTEVAIDSILIRDGQPLTIAVQSPEAYYVDDFRLTLIARYIDPTPVQDILAAPARHRGIYTLQGLRIDRITRPGLYIIDGRKVMVK